MNFKLGNVLVGGFTGIVFVTLANYLFYDEFTIRGLLLQFATVFIIGFIIWAFQYKKKQLNLCIRHLEKCLIHRFFYSFIGLYVYSFLHKLHKNLTRL